MARKKSETRISFEKKFASERRKRIKAGKPGDGEFLHLEVKSILLTMLKSR